MNKPSKNGHPPQPLSKNKQIQMMQKIIFDQKKMLNSVMLANMEMKAQILASTKDNPDKLALIQDVAKNVMRLYGFDPDKIDKSYMKCVKPAEDASAQAGGKPLPDIAKPRFQKKYGEE